MRKTIVRIAFSLAVLATLGVGATSTFGQQLSGGPSLVVANPNAGDMLTPGAFAMQGVAFDPAATAGAGVDRVSVFLGDRDRGGMFLGDATLGKPATAPVPSDQFAYAGWTLVTPALNGTGEMTELYVYARSAVTREETMLDVPIAIGEKPAATTRNVVTGGTSDCERHACRTGCG